MKKTENREHPGTIAEMDSVEQEVLKELEHTELNLSDFALFLSVMKNREAHRCVLSIIMEDPGLVLTQVQVEEVVLNRVGKRTKYRQLPPTVVTFITQEDIFGRDQAKYTFTEQCQEIEGLCLEDGTTKIFLNMASKNGDPVLVSMLQYMKKTRLDNPEISVHDGFKSWIPSCRK